jgi:hypothetical protein
MKWFTNCTTQDQLKKVYRELAKQHHPDLGGSVELMQEINNEFEFASAKLAKGENLSTEEINATILENELYREAIDKIIALEGINIEVVGSWIWVTGSTFPVKDTLKAAGFFFASKKLAWYFRTAENICKGGKKTLDQIRAKYGSERINGKFNSSYRLS